MEKTELKKETGNNSAGKTAREILSIRFSPNGFSFHALTAMGIRAGEQVRKIKKEGGRGEGKAIERALDEAGLFDRIATWDAVYLFPETERSLLVPDACLKQGMEINYLSVNVFDLKEEETAIVSAPVDAIRAIMALPCETVACLETLFPNARYFSPLQLFFAAPEPCTTRLLMLRGKTVIAAFSNSLQYAEILPCSSVADLLYCLNRLPSELQRNRVVVSNVGKSDLKILHRYHKIEVEDFVTLLSRFDTILGAREDADYQR